MLVPRGSETEPTQRNDFVDLGLLATGHPIPALAWGAAPLRRPPRLCL